MDTDQKQGLSPLTVFEWQTQRLTDHEAKFPLLRQERAQRSGERGGEPTAVHTLTEANVDQTFTTPGQLRPLVKGAVLQTAPTRAHPTSVKFTGRQCNPHETLCNDGPW